MVHIALYTLFPEYWRYNTVIMCGGYDESDKELFVATTDDTIAEVGDNLHCAPEGFDIPYKVELSVEECPNLYIAVYVIPHSIDESKNVKISDHPPFEATIKITRAEETLYCKSHLINYWSGISFETKL